MATASEVTKVQFEVGGAVQSKCGKCKAETKHTVLAMVDEKPSKVRCTLCDSDHKFRAPPKPRAAKRTRVAKVDPDVEMWTKLSAKWDSAKATKYSMSGVFAKSDLVNHPTFGLGQVQLVLVSNKMKVLFETGMKLLVHSK